MKKKVLSLMLALVLVFSLAACGSDSSSSDSDSQDENTETEAAVEDSDDENSGDESGDHEEVTIRFYNYALSEEAKASWWEDTIADFEAQNDWINIETITVEYNSMVSTFTNDIASGLSVDMILGEVSWIPVLAEAGFIDAPEDILDPDFYSGYYDYVLDQLSYNGTVYAVPHYWSDSVIFINKDLIEAAGLSVDDFPDTLDGLKEWIEILSDYYEGGQEVSTIFGLTSAEVSATGANINAMYKAFGGTLINEDGTLADLTTGQNATAMEEMLDFYNYLIGNGYTQENLKLKDYRASFGAGNVCMYVDSTWGYAQIAEVDPNADSFTVTASLPTTMGTYGTGASLVESHCFLIGSGLSDDQKEAVDLFIQYCTDADTMEYYLNNIGLAFPGHVNTEGASMSPVLEGAAANMDNTAVQPMIESIMSVQTELATLVLNYTVNGLSLEDAVADYISEAEYYINQ